jgi:Zn-dependent peptidase ImmA (M78 family)/transcriptional regulator with XRE-family HTH domain
MSKDDGVYVRPEIYKWAIERASLDVDINLIKKTFNKLDDWISGKSNPTYKQLEDFAKKLYIPLVYLFLSEPQIETPPIADFRTFHDSEMCRFSLNLIETIERCLLRQAWYENYAIENRLDKIDFIGKYSLSDNPCDVAKEFIKVLNITLDDRKKFKSKDDMLQYFQKKIDDAGVFVMSNSVVDNNNYRKLRVDEFRGFALSSQFAPLIFINYSDCLAGQIFTLFHEFGHLLLGESGLSDVSVNNFSTISNEKWCNELAAELLVPSDLLINVFNKKSSILDEIKRLVNIFKVSNLVMIRRLHDLSFINKKEFNSLFSDEMKSINSFKKRKSAGGNYFATIKKRIGNRFIYAVISDTLSRNTRFTDAFSLINIKNTQQFDKLAKKLEII